MNRVTTSLVAVLLLSGCIGVHPRSPEQTNRVPKAGNEGEKSRTSDAPDPMDGVFSAASFRSLSLPKVDNLPFLHRLNSLDIAVDSTGCVSVAGTYEVSPPILAGILAKAVHDYFVDHDHWPTHYPPAEVVVGADENTPFDEVWPVLVACASSGIWSVGLAISSGQQEYMSILRVILPQASLTNAPYPSYLVLKANAEYTIIGLQTNGIARARYKAGHVTDRKWIGSEAYSGCIHDTGDPPLGDIDTGSNSVCIVTAPGTSYCQVVTLIYWWRYRCRADLGGLFLLRRDTIPIFENKQE